MPIMLDGSLAQQADPRRFAAFGRPPRDLAPAPSACIEIGLVNNMPDTALYSTEQQFIELLTAAAGSTPVRLHLFALPDIERGETGREHVRLNYADVAQLGRTPLDALIVTGNEPRAAALDDEPYWKSLTEVIDWAEDNTTSTLFSCLAAHAAVLHLDGISRRRLPIKRSGIYRCLPVADHPLLAGAGPHMTVPHSRWNDLAEDDLVAHGYTMLTRAKGAGIDTFAKQTKSLFLFFQGHPEYHADALLREYRRDVGRFVRGEAAGYPTLPTGYFSRGSEAELTLLAARAPHQAAETTMTCLSRAMRIRPSLLRQWRASTVPLMSNWLRHLSAHKKSEAA